MDNIAQMEFTKLEISLDMMNKGKEFIKGHYKFSNLGNYRLLTKNTRLFFWVCCSEFSAYPHHSSFFLPEAENHVTPPISFYDFSYRSVRIK